MSERHEVQAMGGEGSEQVRIRCACGWESEPQASEAEAGDRFRRHLVDVGGSEPAASQ